MNVKVRTRWAFFWRYPELESESWSGQLWEGTYRLGSYDDDIGDRCDCVALSVLTFPDQRVHTEDHDEVLDSWDRSHISWCYLTIDVVLPSLRSRVVTGMGKSLCTVPKSTILWHCSQCVLTCRQSLDKGHDHDGWQLGESNSGCWSNTNNLLKLNTPRLTQSA